MNEKQVDPSENILQSSSIESFVNYVKKKQNPKILVMTGAGVSTSAGIPDFRSPKTGLYANLQKYNLPFAEAVFELSYFLQKPEPFYELSRELFPGAYQPTISHHFIKILEERKLLLRNYSQNIDMLERLALISSDKIVEAHGSFHTASCVGSAKLIDEAKDPFQNRDSDTDSDRESDDGNHIIRIPGCGKKFTLEEFKSRIFRESIPRCSNCSGLIKPDIVFFGEQLPHRFHSLIDNDFSNCDALIVMGTSLQVMPFASLINSVGEKVPRLLINLEEVGVHHNSNRGFDFTGTFQKYKRDAFFKGTTDEGAKVFCELMGWNEDLKRLISSQKTIPNPVDKPKVKEEDIDLLESALSNVKL
jgi:NAD-dependent deacetylase sirtuin 2